MTDIRRLSPAEVDALFERPELPALLEQYGAESALPEIGQQCAVAEMYLTLNQSGMFRVIGAFDEDGRLVGVISFLFSLLPHYGKVVATSESFFVAPEYRRGAVGLKLLAEAAQWAKEVGAAALMVSAPVGGRLAQVMPHLPGWRATNTVFTTALP
jgi:GNAT superfamily N-acetyltransferase